MSADVHALSGAYAVNALEAGERGAFEAHLEACGVCRLEVATLQATAARLSSAVVVRPPEVLGCQTIRATTDTAQVSGVVPRRPSLSRRGRWIRSIATAAAVLAMAAMTHSAAQTTEMPSARLANGLLDTADARIHTVSHEAGMFRLVTSRALGLMTIRAGALAPSSHMTFQLWVISDHARSLGVLGDEGFVRRTPTAGRVAVTIEPAGGSLQPTRVPLFSVDVTKL